MSGSPEPEAARAPLIRASGVTAGYTREAVIHDVDLEVQPGEFVALVGPNGSGKSTLLKVLLGVLRPWAGEVSLLGLPPGELRDRDGLGYVPQRPQLASEVPATVAEIVSAGLVRRGGWWRSPSAHEQEEVRHAIGSVGLADEADRPLQELSVGQQQRAFIARAFACDPRLLVLDEPIAGVDRGSQARFRDSLVHLIEEHGAGVLLVSHELSAVAETIDRIVVLKRTVVFDGSPAELAERGVSLGIHRDDLPLWLEGLQ